MFDEATINEAARRLREASPPGTRVILFGSYARGEADKHSDLDFLVIQPEEPEHSTLESVRLRRELDGLRVGADILVASAQKVEDWREVRGSVYRTALIEGREPAARWQPSGTSPSNSSSAPATIRRPHERCCRSSPLRTRPLGFMPRRAA